MLSNTVINLHFGPKFLYKAVSFHDWGNKKVFRDISLFSAVPKMAGLFIDAMSTSGRESMKAQKPVRLLKDAILSFEAGRDGCGRHVDDIGFWPCYEEVSGTVCFLWSLVYFVSLMLGYVSEYHAISYFRRQCLDYIITHHEVRRRRACRGSR
jgi:hypothetical protein